MTLIFMFNFINLLYSKYIGIIMEMFFTKVVIEH